MQREGIALVLGLFTQPSDRDVLVTGWRRLRRLMADAPFGSRLASEAYPGPAVRDTDTAVRDHLRSVAVGAHHPVDTLAMGTCNTSVTPHLTYRSLAELWVADASVMPAMTSANTNAPSIMIGHHAAKMIVKDAR